MKAYGKHYMHEAIASTRPRNSMRMAMGFMSLIWSLVAISMTVTESAGDEAALLAFREQLSDGGSRELASWNSSAQFCGWEGVTCSRQKPTRVLALNLYGSKLTGELSPALGNLTFLQKLNLSFNGLHGEIPGSLGRLRRLRTLDLSFNSFSGILPVNLSSCISLTTMVIQGNKLVGRIPAELGESLTSLSVLLLRNNSFTGPIPASLGNLSHLQFFSLSNNQLTGTIPPELGNIQSMQRFGLFGNNLSGMLPPSLYNLSSLEILDIGYNMLYGSIPADIGDKFPRMKILSLARNQFTGAIPSSLFNLSDLTELFLGRNRFSGYVPPTLGRMGALQILNLHENKLEANDKQGWEFITSLANCSQLGVLSLSGNSFGGALPGEVVNLSTTLQTLYLPDNRIFGSIPADIGNLVGLNKLVIANTSMSGVIPESIGKLENLIELGLYSNGLTGLIPPSIGNLTKLSRLLAYQNNLEGPIPSSLGNLKKLSVLHLSTNYHLNGSIPKYIFMLPSVLYKLDVSYNSLSGPLPSEVGSMTNLNALILSGNKLSGEIPNSIGNCIVLEQLLLDNNSFEGGIPRSLKNIKGLSKMNLTMNGFSGKIPDALGSIGNLQQLYLAHNNFSGPIPTVLQNLTLLWGFDISYNDLKGEVPKGGVFENLTSISVTGNRKLCGGILQLHLAPCSTYSMSKNRKKTMVISVATSVAMLFLLSVTIIIWKLKIRRKSQDPPPALIEEQFQRVSYHALSRGTDGFAESNLLGKGRYGSVYKCKFEGEDASVAVKLFNLQQSGSSRSFEAECKALRIVRHRCLMKIITCCSSLDNEGQEFKALVFEFMPNGSLDGWIHQKSSMPTPSNTLSLAQRLDIAVDIIDALDYIHNHCQPPIAHCDLKPSNILLAEDMSARVGDFGISRILSESASITMQNSYSSVGVRGTIGYIAPEYGEGSSVSTIADVYSLGILLLEMFTGRSPTDDMFRGSLDLHKFSEAALPDRILEIADPTILMHHNVNGRIPRVKTEECFVSAIRLGLSCSKQQPKERMPICDAAVEMHAIRDSYLLSAGSLIVEHEGEIEASTLR